VGTLPIVLPLRRQKLAGIDLDLAAIAERGILVVHTGCNVRVDTETAVVPCFPSSFSLVGLMEDRVVNIWARTLSLRT
jgi:hypothetical protein